MLKLISTLKFWPRKNVRRRKPSGNSEVRSICSRHMMHKFEKKSGKSKTKKHSRPRPVWQSNVEKSPLCPSASLLKNPLGIFWKKFTAQSMDRPVSSRCFPGPGRLFSGFPQFTEAVRRRKSNILRRHTAGNAAGIGGGPRRRALSKTFTNRDFFFRLPSTAPL